MDIDILIQDVRDQLDEPDSSYLTDEIILRWLNQAQRIIALKTKCIKGYDGVALEEGQSMYEVPTIFSIEQVFLVERSTQNLIRLCQTTWKELERIGYTNLSHRGRPQFWIPIIQGRTRTIMVVPSPSSSDYMLQVFGSKMPDDMYYEEGGESNIGPELPEEYQDALITWCRYKYRLMEEDTEQAMVFLSEFNGEMREIRSAEFFRHQADAPSIAIDYWF